MTQLVLSLFPGIGLFDMAFEETGFCVVRGPDVLWGGDIKRFSPPAGRFEGIIGGPPCQAFSRLRHIVEANGYQVAENLIPEYERVVAEAAPAWFVMENVPAAPEPVVLGYAVASVLLNNRWFGADQNRQRRISFGLRGAIAPEMWRYLGCELAPLESPTWEHAVVGSASSTPVRMLANGQRKRTADRPPRSIHELSVLQGVSGDWLDHAPFTADAKRQVLANGVPLPTGRAIARAVLAMVAVA